MTELEWKMAKQWICSMHIEPANGRAFELSEDLFEFAESLRDGIILCQIANKLAVGCVRNINRVNNIDKHMFFCLININNFLKACVEVFSIAELDLFSAKDLYYVTNFQGVINTLSVLSRTPQAIKIHKLNPFPPEDYKPVSKRQEEDIYGTLPEILERKPLATYVNTDVEETIYDQVDSYEKIYDSIVHCRKSLVVTGPSIDKRSHIVNEILDTEDSYLDNLKIMVEEYIKKLKNYMNKEDKEIVFMNTENIYSVHLTFNRELSNRKTISAAEHIKMDVEAFVRYKEQFLIYAYYCSGLPAAQQHAMELTKSDNFREALENLNRKMDRKFPLQEQLVVAFQRILKYPLLLRDLKKHTPEDHEDFPKIERAFDAMDDVALYINEFNRDIENVERVKQIANSVKFEIPNAMPISTYGRHVTDGELQVRFDTDKKVKEKRYAFLFEHTLLLCKCRGVTYVVKEIFDLLKFSLIVIQSNGRGKFSQGWSLQAHTSDGISENKNCVIYTKTLAEKTSWVSELTKCIKTVTLSDFEGKLEGHKFNLTTFKNTEKCLACEKLLRGQISQGYKCMVQGCGFIIHKDCLHNCPRCLPRKSQSLKNNLLSSVRKPTSAQQGLRAGRRTMPSNTELKQSTFEKKISDDGRSWFAGSMSRDKASDMLKNCVDGSFLIRESPNDPGGLVMTICYDDVSFHIKIMKMNKCYYLTDTKLFNSIDDMIAYYQTHSLVNSFPQLPTMLTRLVSKRVKRIMQVIFPWSARNERELTFQEGQVVSVLNDEGNWWFGECDGKEGYFPRNYVG